MPDPAPPPAPGPDTLPPRTTPTWEMELLLSGATVFALFQVYGVMTDVGVWLGGRLPVSSRPWLSPLLVYVQTGVLGLALGFLLHLVMRAFWVAAVGMRSIDPKGDVRNSGTLGPEQQRLVGARWDTLEARIASLDDTATLVFAAALGLARLMAQLTLLASVAVGVGLVLDAATVGRVHAAQVVAVLLLVFMTPLMAAVLSDNRAGRRGRPSPRLTVRTLHAYARLGLTADSNLGLQLATHRLSGRSNGQRGTLLMTGVVLALVLAVFFGQLKARGQTLSVLDQGFPTLPVGAPRSLRTLHYLDRLPEGLVPRVPLIASEQVEGPYLRLFVPWVAEWHQAPWRGCAATLGEGWTTDPVATAAALRCLAEGQPLSVDGQPVDAPWLLSEDQRRDVRGFAVMIDVRGLSPGLHELQVAQRLADGESAGETPAWRIPFWL